MILKQHIRIGLLFHTENADSDVPLTHETQANASGAMLCEPRRSRELFEQGRTTD